MVVFCGEVVVFCVVKLVRKQAVFWFIGLKAWLQERKPYLRGLKRMLKKSSLGEKAYLGG